MKEGDPLPVDVTRLAPSAYCGCVITKPEVSPFVAEARRLGCVTGTGTDMYEQHQGIMVDFLLGPRRRTVGGCPGVKACMLAHRMGLERSRLT